MDGLSLSLKMEAIFLVIVVVCSSSNNNNNSSSLNSSQTSGCKNILGC